MLSTEPRGFPPIHHPDIFPDFKDSTVEDLREVFEEVEAQNWIDTWRRVDTEGRLDIEATARRAGADIVRTTKPAEHGHATLHVRNGRWRIEEHIEGSEAQRTFLIGHELGHVAVFSHYIQQGTAVFKEFHRSLSQDENYKRTEAFCDYFSLRLIGVRDTFDTVDWNNLPLASGEPAPNPWRPTTYDVPLFDM